MLWSFVAVATGALMYWGLTTQSSSIGQANGYRFSEAGMILMIAGGAGFVTCSIIFALSRGSSTEQSVRTMDSQTITSLGSSTRVHEEQR
jgi:hypothetical protein